MGHRYALKSHLYLESKLFVNRSNRIKLKKHRGYNPTTGTKIYQSNLCDRIKCKRYQKLYRSLSYPFNERRVHREEMYAMKIAFKCMCPGFGMEISKYSEKILVAGSWLVIHPTQEFKEWIAHHKILSNRVSGLTKISHCKIVFKKGEESNATLFKLRWG
jgi:hypothetical protein